MWNKERSEGMGRHSGARRAGLGDRHEVANKGQIKREQGTLGPCLGPWVGISWGKGDV